MFVKYLKPKSTATALWRVRDEGFRLSNRGGMGGWLWISATFTRVHLPAPEKLKPGTDLQAAIPEVCEFTFAF